MLLFLALQSKAIVFTPGGHTKHWGREGEHEHPSTALECHSLVEVAGFICSEIASQTEGWSSEKHKKAD